MKITLFSKDGCFRCKSTARFFNEHGIEFEEHNLTQEPDMRDEALSYGFMSLPVVVVDENTAWTGFDMPKLQQLAIKIKNGEKAF